MCLGLMLGMYHLVNVICLQANIWGGYFLSGERYFLGSHMALLTTRGSVWDRESSPWPHRNDINGEWCQGVPMHRRIFLLLGWTKPWTVGYCHNLKKEFWNIAIETSVTSLDGQSSCLRDPERESRCLSIWEDTFLMWAHVSRKSIKFKTTRAAFYKVNWISSAETNQ
jgi:hypothetical protein